MDFKAPVLKPEDLAQRWGCSAKTVKTLLNDGKLKGFRVGSAWRIRQEHVEEYELGSASNVQETDNQQNSSKSKQPSGDPNAPPISEKPKRLARLDVGKLRPLRKND